MARPEEDGSSIEIMKDKFSRGRNFDGDFARSVLPFVKVKNDAPISNQDLYYQRKERTEAPLKTAQGAGTIPANARLGIAIIKNGMRLQEDHHAYLVL
jgi:hypothetical protein